MDRRSIDAKPRGECPVCNQGFSPATDREWEHRWRYHLLFSLRHKKYLELASKPPERIFFRPGPAQNSSPSPTV
jgi:hypothetical protein